MNEPNPIEEFFASVLSDYITTFGIAEPIIPNYRIVESIGEEYIALRPDLIENSATTIESLNHYNGFAVPPKKVGGQFTVLINSKSMLEKIQKKQMDWVGTIAHETTHVQDFAEYAKIVGADEYEEILRTDVHGMFDLWTEIHARSKGYYFTRKYTLSEEYMNCSELLPDIMDREIPTHWQMLYEQYHATTDGFQQAYLVAQYIGRLYTLQQLYPNDITDSWIELHFGENSWMTEWFLFFKKYPVLKDAANHFEEMKDILGQNFRGI